MKKTGSCLYCGKNVEYYDTQSNGKYCSNQCQIDFGIEKKLRMGTVFSKGIRSWCYRHLEQKCSACGVTLTWNGKPLRLQVDHKNGNTKDNRRENLRMICPNCHTQTENWGSKNASEEARLRMVEGAAYLRSLINGVVA